MTTCNGERFLHQQLDSLAASVYRDFELVVCDDASEDETCSILEAYADRLPVRLYRNERRLGFVRNFEKVMGLCRGRYIALCDQDDVWQPDKLAKSVEAMISAERMYGEEVPVMVHSDSRLIDSDGSELAPSYQHFKGYIFRKEKQYGAMLFRSGVMGHTMVLNRSLAEKALPFPESLDHHDYWIALVNEWFGRRISLAQCLVDYRVHSANSGGKGKQGAKLPWRLPYHEESRYLLLRSAMARYKIPGEARESFVLAAVYLRRRRKLLRLYPAMAIQGFFPVGFWRHCKRVLRIAAVEWGLV